MASGIIQGKGKKGKDKGRILI